MDKTYKHQNFEQGIYEKWEKSGHFTPKINKNKKPFTILLPLPNANDPLHLGHALFVVQDILCRWHRMMGDTTLYLPGTDHAGIETQYVFEKKLAETNKSRFDFDRKTLYQMINDYVEENRDITRKQLRRLGYSFDWTREKYSLEPEILEIVFETFRKLHKDGLIYRGERIVNFCTNCGTAFSNLEIEYIDRNDSLYYFDYGLVKIATTRPETIFADTAVAVNPADNRYKNLIGKEATLPFLNKKIPIIADELVDPEFGTGALKITPGHDTTDFEIGQKHNLEVIKVIDISGKMINVPEKYLGMTVQEARKKAIESLEKNGKLIKKEPLSHSVAVCYRCKNLIEPLTTPQWYLKIKPLARPAIKALKKGELKIVPKRFEKLYLQWMENIKDWNISRQIVWGPRIPAWYCLDCNSDIVIDFINKKGKRVSGEYKDLKKEYEFSEIKKGLQNLMAFKDAEYSLEGDYCKKCKSKNIIQETDTFDTWFLSGQWPITTLGFPDSDDFKYFYPTSVLDTLWDILFFWVARMVMFGLYQTGKVPFEVAHMHCRVVDEKGKKMSKSKGNVINPIKMVDKYGADALRMALVFGTSPGNDICVGEDKLRAMRNFTNKIWNAARFVYLMAEKNDWHISFEGQRNEHDKKILEKADKLVKSVVEDLEKYRFGQALEKIYQFFWHEFCDIYIEQSKDQINEALPTLIDVLMICLKLIHPFAPFVSEAIYQIFREKLKNTKLFERDYLTISSWPE